MLNNLESPETRNLWESQEDSYQRVLQLKGESPRTVLGSNFEEAFSKWPNAVGCIDERLPYHRIGIAGSGVLMNETEIKETALKISRVNDIRDITYHDRCRACDLVSKERKNRKPFNHVGFSSAQKLHSALKLKGRPKRAGYDDSADFKMHGLPDFHHARMVIVDGTGCFNQTILDLPNAFLLSARFAPNMDYLQKELRMVLNIAMGKSGFGEKKFNEKPLIVLFVGDTFCPSFNSWRLKQKLEPVLAAFRETVVAFTISI